MIAVSAPIESQIGTDEIRQIQLLAVLLSALPPKGTLCELLDTASAAEAHSTIMLRMESRLFDCPFTDTALFLTVADPEFRRDMDDRWNFGFSIPSDWRQRLAIARAAPTTPCLSVATSTRSTTGETINDVA